jgi:hypothetical protein
MEDASAVDLDWFWRGWFFGTDPVDISIDSVKWYRLDDADNAAAFQQKEFEMVGQKRNRDDKSITFATDADTALRDYYYNNRNADQKMGEQAQRAQQLSRTDSANLAKWSSKQFYELTFSNRGGLPMPIIVEWTFRDGTKQVDRIPVTIWRSNEKQVSKVFMKDQEVTSIRLDPGRETADINEANGQWPVKELPSRFQLFKGGQQGPRGGGGTGNAMQKAQKAN